MAETKVGKDEILDRTRRVQMQLTAGSGTGVALGTDQGVRVVFSGTPAEFARASGILPMDYVAGSNITIKFFINVDSAQTVNYVYYAAANRNGLVSGSWNLANNAPLSGSAIAANTIQEVSVPVTFSSNNFQAGDQISIAIRPNVALTGSLYLNLLFIEYTADS